MMDLERNRFVNVLLVIFRQPFLMFYAPSVWVENQLYDINHSSSLGLLMKYLFCLHIVFVQSVHHRSLYVQLLLYFKRYMCNGFYKMFNQQNPVMNPECFKVYGKQNVISLSLINTWWPKRWLSTTDIEHLSYYFPFLEIELN